MSQPQSEKNVFVEFFMEAKEFKVDSEREGRPVFKEIPHIRIVIPGDRNVEFVDKATPYFQNLYPQAWARFQASQKDEVIGTPLAQWPMMNRALVKEANFYNIQTVEQLAEISDANIQRLGMGWTEWRRKAQAYLAAARGDADRSAQDSENQRLKAEIEALKAQFEAMADGKKPGRPRKETAEAD